MVNVIDTLSTSAAVIFHQIDFETSAPLGTVEKPNIEKQKLKLCMTADEFEQEQIFH